MRSYSVTCSLKQVKVPYFDPNRYTYSRGMEGWVKLMYTSWTIKSATKRLPICLLHYDRIFFHWHTPRKSCNNIIVKYPTTKPWLCRFTTLWNMCVFVAGCRCEAAFSTGNCETGTGRCICRPEYAGVNCDRLPLHPATTTTTTQLLVHATVWTDNGNHAYGLFVYRRQFTYIFEGALVWTAWAWVRDSIGTEIKCIFWNCIPGFGGPSYSLFCIIASSDLTSDQLPRQEHNDLFVMFNRLASSVTDSFFSLLIMQLCCLSAGT